MSLFLLLVGFILGFAITGGEDAFLSGGAILPLLGILVYAIHLRKWPFAVIGIAAGLLFGLIPIGPFEGDFNGVGIVIESKSNYVIVLSSFKRYYVSVKNNEYQIFDFVHFQGAARRVYFANYESRFDFNLYLARLGVKTEIAATSHELRFGFPIRFHRWENNFLSSLSQDAKGFYAKLLFRRSDESSAYLDQGDALGLLHLLSTSGIIYGLLLRVIKRFARPFDTKISQNTVGSLVCLFFFPLGLKKIGILRIMVMEWTKWVLEKRKMHPDPLTRSSGVGILLLCLNPYYALQTGFLLPFGISSFLELGTGITDHLKDVAKQAATLGLVYLFLLPVLISNGPIHLFAPLYAILLTPIIFFCFLFGYLGFFLVPIKGLLEGMALVASKTMWLFEKADISFYITIDNAAVICVYYFLLYVALYLFELTDYRRCLQLTLIPAAAYALSFVPVQYGFTSQISFINVGQGDAILLRGHDTVVLMDTGGVSGFDMGEEVLIPYLRKQRIYHIDAIIASHHDHDHIGGVAYLQEHFKVRGYYDEASMFPLQVGPFYFENLNIYSWDEENDKSLVFLLDFMDRKWMLTGDAPSKVEQKILEDHDDLDCDVLKVGHHGSSTSTCDAWLDALSPELAIISCGRNNKYKHPNDDVLERLSAHHVTIRRTDLEGTITYTKFG